jgi:hypothetical protein
MAAELNGTTAQLDNLRRQGAIPFIQVGHFIRFDRDAVIAALQRYTVQEANYHLRRLAPGTAAAVERSAAEAEAKRRSSSSKA